MTYFNLNKVTDPPLDELVDEVTQINDNWQELDDKTKPMTVNPSVFGAIPLVQGLEAFDPAGTGRIALWTGAQWVRGIEHSFGTGAWTALAIRAPIVARTGFPPVAKVDTWSRKITLAGGVILNATADPFVTGTTYEITTDAAISPTLIPVNGGQSIQYGAVGAITAASGFGSAVVTIESKSSPSRTAISVRYQGDAGGGNFIMLDGITWWY